MQVNLENNKYTLTFDEGTGALLAERNGEYWMDYSGNKLVYLLLARIVELETNQEQMIKSLEWFVENDDTNIGMAGNEYWEDGLNEGIRVIALVKGAVPMTDEEILAIGRELGKTCRLSGNPDIDFDYARAIEAHHGIGAKP